MDTCVVTGAAGFIGFHVAKTLCERQVKVIGIDNLNDYYDVSLKKARLDQLEQYQEFIFHHLDVADAQAVKTALDKDKDSITHIVHLAAQAGVRYSLENPFVYAQSNMIGHLVVLELCRHLPNFEHLVYASSSSVYGGNTELPFNTEQKVDKPISLYAATKRADELMSYSYSHLYDIPATGLRFFTVYGPWGRPDMAYFSFTKAIIEQTPIRLFGHGDMARDFTYIDDVVTGVTNSLTRTFSDNDSAPHRLYNIGNDRAENLLDFVAVLEESIGKKAIIEMYPMQPGDVRVTHADIDNTRQALDYNPKTTIEEGLPRFVSWYQDYYRV